jgi:hypothetical protein
MAEAISFRRGNKSDNDVFVGVPGEIVVDLGDGVMASQNERVDRQIKSTAPTLRFHTGNGLAGGIRLARADMVNVNTEFLGSKTDGEDSHEGPNLLYEDLSNISTPSESTIGLVTAQVQETLDLYGVALKDMSNIDTEDLATVGHGHAGKNLAYSDMSNVNTSSLVQGGSHLGKHLAYADTSNINTADLVDAEKHDGENGNKPLAYVDMSNVNTSSLGGTLTTAQTAIGKKLAYADLTNIQDQTLIDKIDNSGAVSTIYEQVSRKIGSQDFDDPTLITDTNYPSALAIKNYVDQSIGGLDYANQELSNITDWSVSTLNNTFYTNNAAKSDGGHGYTTGESIITNIDVNTPSGIRKLTIVILETNEDGAITEYELSDETKYGNTALTSQTYTDPEHGAIFEISSVQSEFVGGSLMKNDMSNAKDLESDAWSGKFYYNHKTLNYNNDTIDVVIPALKSTFKGTGDYATLDGTGTANVARYDIDNVAHGDVTPIASISVNGSNDTPYKNIFVTKEGAYYCSGWDYSRDSLISTVGYCDEKQNTQNILPATGATTNVITLNKSTAIYSLDFAEINENVEITIDKSSLDIANNTAKTFEIYVTTGNYIPDISWVGVDAWLSDSEQSPLSTNITSIFTVRVQKINNVVKVVANYGGEF